MLACCRKLKYCQHERIYAVGDVWMEAQLQSGCCGAPVAVNSEEPAWNAVNADSSKQVLLYRLFRDLHSSLIETGVYLRCHSGGMPVPPLWKKPVQSSIHDHLRRSPAKSPSAWRKAQECRGPENGPRPHQLSSSRLAVESDLDGDLRGVGAKSLSAFGTLAIQGLQAPGGRIKRKYFGGIYCLGQNY